jgi:dienelactone hydrolase
MAQLAPERIASDGTAYLDYLGKLASQPLDITGYCLGGRPVWG